MLMSATSCLCRVKRTAKYLKSAFSSRRASPFARDESGAIAIIFAVALLPMILMVGAAIDYSRIALDRAEAQDALDAATLAVVKRLATLKDNEVRSMVEAYVAANVPSGVSINIDLVEIERNPNKLKLWASGSTKTTFMRLANINSADFKANSSAVASDKSIEVVLVLDNSGSMGGSRIRALKEASNALVDILEENNVSKKDLSIGVVPFNHLVRLDEGREKAKWLDTNGKSSLNALNLPPNTKRLQTYKTLKDPKTGKPIEWEGCVEARKHPLDVQDTAADKKNDDSYFLPFFYPDSQEPNVKRKNWDNVYLPIRGYAKSTYTNSEKKKYGWYHQQTLKWGRAGPNNSCYVKRLLPLTNSMNTVRSHINGLSANGNTNIHMGTIWGLRLLSAQEPYSQGRPYDDVENVKFMIIMSDGANTYSRYQAYGWTSDNRISGSSNTVKEMDKRTLESCSEAKNAGVILFTIAYGNIGSSTTKMLKDCATLPGNAFTPKSTSEMIKTFKEIAASLNTIRLTE